MSVIPQNIIFIWTGTHASIPSGWTRETTLDARYPKGTAASTNPNDTGGATTHSHSATASHSHTQSSHTHSVSLAVTTSQVGRAYGTQVWQEHTHSSFTSGASSGGDLSSVASTYASLSNDPPYYEVIFIKSDGTQGVPNNAIALFDYADSMLPSNWVDCDGTSGTPNLADKYLKGAGTSQDAGSTGGSTTNIHTLTHTHTVASHTHASATSTNATPTKLYDGWGGVPTGGHGTGTSTHSHTISLNSTTATLTGTASLTTAETVEPAYTKLMAIQNQSGVAESPIGIIGIWLGTLDTIPGGWTLCDGDASTTDMRGKHLKIGTSGQVGNTGGSNTHSHASQTHTHTGVAHNHTGTSSQHPPYDNFGYSPYYTTATGVSATATHAGIVANQTATYANGSTAADSQSNEPEYRTVAFLKLTGKGNSTKANIARFNDTVDNAVKGQVVYKQSSSHVTKANILNTYSNISNVKANIRKAFSHKTFEYRVYDNNTFVTNWSDEVLSLPTFRATINGGAGEMKVRLARTYDDFGESIDVKLQNRVDCYVFDLESPQGSLLYSGYISAYSPVIDGATEYVEVTLLPYISEMERIMLREGSNDTEIVESSVDPSQIFKDIVDKYRADGGRINYTASTVDTCGTTVSYTFQTYTVKEALDKAIELTPQNWYWYIAPDNLLYLKETNLTTATHDLVLGKHFTRLQTERRMEDMVNTVYFIGADDGGDPPVALYRYYSNAGAVTSYGIHATKVTDGRVSATATADIKANRVINQKKDPEIRTTATILDSNGPNIKHGYDIESIKPGDSMRLKNIKQGTKTTSLWDQATWDSDVWDQTLSYAAADVIQVQSIQYHPNYVVIETSSRLPEVPKRMEDIYRNLAEDEADYTGSSPTAA